MSKHITFVLTSCNRFDLLEKTLESFVKYNTAPIAHYIFIEDTHKIKNLEKVVRKFPEIFAHATLLHNVPKLGQMASIDRAYSFVKTDYIFHCEEDWEFYEQGFIEDSLAVLEKDKKIVSVWIRAMNDTNGMPIETEKHTVEERVAYYLLETNYQKVWHGFTLNPGLRRRSDYYLVAPFSAKESEEAISQAYHKLGFRGAILSKGYVRHLGWHRRVLDLKNGKQQRSKLQFEIDSLFKRAKASIYKCMGIYGKKYRR